MPSEQGVENRGALRRIVPVSIEPSSSEVTVGMGWGVGEVSQHFARDGLGCAVVGRGWMGSGVVVWRGAVAGDERSA